MIEVILLERIGRLGQIGQVVKVRPGYARNYLLPLKKALRATKDNLAYFESRRADIEAANAEGRAKAEKLSGKLDGRKFVIIRQASEVGHLFGSVSVRDVAETLHGAGYDVERQNILLAAPVKVLGMHDVNVRLHPEVTVKITLNVARNEDEAKVQEKTGQIAKAKEASVEEAAKLAEAQVEANKSFFEKPAEEAAEAPSA